MEIYKIEDLSFSYPNKEELTLKNINLKIENGEFIVLCGPSGCGKTTLLRHLKTVLTPHGNRVGNIYFEGRELLNLDQREQTSKIGFVMQNPDNQIVTDKVWHELAFGLESLGYKTPIIRLRVSEMASFFGIQNWFYKNVNELSGGQKQLLNLASIMAMQPSVLILDEPTSQLDPIAASDFLATLSKINRELGTTIILTEHRLEDAMPLADRIIVMDEGNIIADGDAQEVGKIIKEKDHKMFLAMPSPMRIYAGVENDLKCPITVREGRNWLDTLYEQGLAIKEIDNVRIQENQNKTAIKIDEIWFKYEEKSQDIIKGLSLEVKEGEFLAILGGNGTGKTTALSLISGINKPYQGQVFIGGKNLNEISTEDRYNRLLGVLPQNPQTLFVKKTVKEDLYEIFKGKNIPESIQDKKVSKMVHLCDLEELLNRHPYDLSGGEQQRVALAKVLLLEPSILLLDEPTKGLDAEFKQKFAGILNILLKNKVTVVMVSHDIEFCAKYANRCALFFDGNIVTENNTRDFFSGNSFYTTSANRMARHRINNCVTVEDVILACGGEIQKEAIINYDEDISEVETKKEKNIRKKWYKNKFIGLISLAIMVVIAIKFYPVISNYAWSSYIMGDNSIKFGLVESQLKYSLTMVVFIMATLIFLLSFFEKDNKKYVTNIQVEKKDRKLSKRTLLASVLVLLLIPLTIYIGVFYLNDRKYYFISMLIILEVMLPFIMIFEGRKPQARELVIISVLCAIGVAGRAAFFMIPQFKPVAAIVIISGVAFGAESGFLVGAITMFLSNMFFSQGPLTPWQMFAMGIIGFLAGILFKKGILRRDKLSLAIFGGISVFLIYGLIMNPASVIVFQSEITWSMILTSLVVGIPHDLVHGAATFFFLMIMGEPMLEKLDRIKVKYGLVEVK